VRAGATFHGGGMAADDMLARIPQMKAHYLVAIAANDDAKAPGDKDKLRAAFAAAKLPAEIQVYPGTMHGWCPPDSKVYDQAQADRAWQRMLALFGTALA
jgi:carboxymethylenebutenolidase